MATKTKKETAFSFSNPPAQAPKTLYGSGDVTAISNFRRSKSDTSFVADVSFSGTKKKFYLCALPDWFARGFDYREYQQAIEDLKQAGEDGDDSSMKLFKRLKGGPYLYKSNVAAGKPKPSAFLETLLACCPEIGDALAEVTDEFTVEAFNEMTPEEAEQMMYRIFEAIASVVAQKNEEGEPIHIGYVIGPETESVKDAESGKWISTPTGNSKFSNFFVPDAKAVAYYQGRAEKEPSKYIASFPE